MLLQQLHKLLQRQQQRPSPILLVLPRDYLGSLQQISGSSHLQLLLALDWPALAVSVKQLQRRAYIGMPNAARRAKRRLAREQERRRTLPDVPPFPDLMVMNTSREQKVELESDDVFAQFFDISDTKECAIQTEPEVTIRSDGDARIQSKEQSAHVNKADDETKDTGHQIVEFPEDSGMDSDTNDDSVVSFVNEELLFWHELEPEMARHLAETEFIEMQMYVNAMTSDLVVPTLDFDFDTLD